MKKPIAEQYNWRNDSVDFDVEETRRLAASHGKDGLIIIAWTDNGDGTVSYNTTTAGKRKKFALHAEEMRDAIMGFLNGFSDDPILVENRIHEHTE